MDLSIPPGEDFVEHIEQGVGSCDVLLALIGPDWLTAEGANGARRLDDPEDFARLEIAAGLARGVRVMPVLVARARMPTAAELPEPLAPLSRRQALEISDTRWRYDVGVLTQAIEQVPGLQTASSGPIPGEESAHGRAGQQTRWTEPDERRHPEQSRGGSAEKRTAPHGVATASATSNPGASATVAGESTPRTGRLATVRQRLVLAAGAGLALLLIVGLVAVALLAGGEPDDRRVTAALGQFQNLLKTGDSAACRLLTPAGRRATAAQVDVRECEAGVEKLHDSVGEVVRDFASAPVRDVKVAGDKATATFVLPANRLGRRAASPLPTELRRSGDAWLISRAPSLRPANAPIDEQGMRDHIPSAIDKKCFTRDRKDWPDTAIASVICEAGKDLYADYSLFGTESRMTAYYRSILKVPMDTGECPSDVDPESEEAYQFTQNPDQDVGRLNCYLTDDGSGAYWTTDRLLILGNLVGSRDRLKAVHKKWLEAGPNL